MVAYQDGDRDRPLVTAIVPNPPNPVPYDLTGNETRMVFRSNMEGHNGVYAVEIAKANVAAR